MYIQIITLFPNVFEQIIQTSMLRKAGEQGLAEIEICNLRDFGLGKHKRVDDKPYGGGEGMILRVDVVDKAITACRKRALAKLQAQVPVILTTPQGKTYKQSDARALAEQDGLIIVCGHYEGFDERIRELSVDLQLSVGDYILTGGEIPAMVIADSIVRLLPGVLASESAGRDESFEHSMLEYPHYTRPPVYKEQKVPDILLSGDHGRIARWRKEQQVKRTTEKRPDLLKNKKL